MGNMKRFTNGFLMGAAICLAFPKIGKTIFRVEKKTFDWIKGIVNKSTEVLK